jgi:ATP-dependent Lon protease
MVMYVRSPNRDDVCTEFEARLRRAEMPSSIRAEALRQLGRLSALPPDTFEHYLIRGYLEAVIELPWSDRMQTEERVLTAMLEEDRERVGGELSGSGVPSRLE